MKTSVQLIINHQWTVAQLEQMFKKHFPNLSLEVYRNGEEISRTFRTLPLAKIGDARQPTDFLITEQCTVAELVEAFWENMGMQVAISRKLANSKVETTYTSKWTLERQNTVGGVEFGEFESKL